MSPLVGRSRGDAPVDPDREREEQRTHLRERALALREAVDAGGRELEPVAAGRAGTVAAKVDERTALAGDHTIVALAGATGSGKSSLTNALAGAEVTEPGIKRPTTSTTSAVVWGSAPATEVLDWIGVHRRHRAQEGPGPDSGEAVAPGALDGLVLLDLPDFDSRETAHHAEADRVLDMADLFLWVTDPQKYADARMHDDYIRARRHHDTVMLVVLNQADLLPPEAREEVLADLRGLLERDGVGDVRVLPVSARTGLGLDALRDQLAQIVAENKAVRARLLGDVRTSAEALLDSVGEREPEISLPGDDRLVPALSRAAGVPTVLRAVEADHLRRATAATGWPVTRWVRHLRPDPLKRLRLGEGEGAGKDFSAARGRSSIPEASQTATSAVDLACREVGDAASVGLPRRWAEAVMDAAVPPIDRLSDELDTAVRRTGVQQRSSWWWPVVGVLQWLLLLATVVGLVWLVLLALGEGFLMLPLGEPPTWRGLPIPALLLVGGLSLGLLLALLARFMAGFGARRRRRQVGREMHGAIGEVAQQRVLDPVNEVLDRHRRTRELLHSALD
ncbi:GTPase [Kytococcus sedentarius]|uniref:GTPase n=1 Tax=Kytococcus sedentarius TaxID=1276 RepID=UPI0035BBC810